MKQPTIVQWISLAIMLLTVLSQEPLVEPYRAYVLLVLGLINAVLAWLNGMTATHLKREAHTQSLRATQPGDQQ